MLWSQTMAELLVKFSQKCENIYSLICTNSIGFLFRFALLKNSLKIPNRTFWSCSDSKQPFLFFFRKKNLFVHWNYVVLCMGGQSSIKNKHTLFNAAIASNLYGLKEKPQIILKIAMKRFGLGKLHFAGKIV